MNIVALRRMAELLHQVQAEIDKGVPNKGAFDLSTWIDTESMELFDKLMDTQPEDRYKTVLHTCGTSACAIGYALLDPWFNAQGFKPDRIGPAWVGPMFQELTQWPAVLRFFQLNDLQAHHLFSPNAYAGGIYGKVDPERVAERILRYVERQEAKDFEVGSQSE